ncbi:hypothetical protein ISCGN_015576 [Ixodes scapularis]
MLQSSDLEGMRKNADQKLQDLASKAATKRKSILLADMKDNADGSLPETDEASFTVVNLDSLNASMKSVKCKVCGGDMKIGKGKREYGIAVKLFLACTNCSGISSAWSSPRVNGEERINPFAVNILAAYAMQSTGNRQTALNDVFSVMNISHHGLHTKTWQNYMKKKLAPALACAAKELTIECTQSVRGLYRELDLGNPGNIAVSYDGSWVTRGHLSHNGVGSAIELFTACPRLCRAQQFLRCLRARAEATLPTKLGKTATYAKKLLTRRLGKWRLASFCSRGHGNATTSATQLCFPCIARSSGLRLHRREQGGLCEPGPEAHGHHFTDPHYQAEARRTLGGKEASLQTSSPN